MQCTKKKDIYTHLLSGIHYIALILQNMDNDFHCIKALMTESFSDLQEKLKSNLKIDWNYLFEIVFKYLQSVGKRILFYE